MRVVAGGIVMNGTFFHVAEPTRKQPASPSPLDEWLDRNGFLCRSYDARISRQQCAANRDQGLFLCGSCTQATAEVPAKRRGRPRKPAEMVGGGVDVESFAADRHFQQQEEAYHQGERIRDLLRDPVVLNVLTIMAGRGNRQAAEILAARGRA